MSEFEVQKAELNRELNRFDQASHIKKNQRSEFRGQKGRSNPELLNF